MGHDRHRLDHNSEGKASYAFQCCLPKALPVPGTGSTYNFRNVCIGKVAQHSTACYPAASYV